jgi:putative membrane protein
MYYIVSLLISAGSIFFIADSGRIAGISLQNGYVSALIFAVVLAITNLILGTILRIVTFPLKLITLGLFSFVISLVIVYVTDQIVPSVTLTGWLPIVAIAVVTTVVSFLMKLIK